MRKKVISALTLIIIVSAALFIFEIVRISSYQKNTAQAEMDSTPATVMPYSDITSSPDIENENVKTIYLTFDDGPYMYTEELLNILDEYGVKATFFTTAQNEDYIDLINKEFSSGHAVGIHTYSHKYSQIYGSDKQFIADFYKMQYVIKEQTGSHSKLYRFPGGSSNTVSTHYNKGIITRQVEYLDCQGYKFFDWNITSGDAEGINTAEKIFDNVVNQITELDEQNYIVLQHDIYDYSVEATRYIIEWGLSNGYNFDKLSVDSPTVHFEVVN